MKAEVAVEILYFKDVYSKEGKDRIFFAAHCIVQPPFDELRKVEDTRILPAFD